MDSLHKDCKDFIANRWNDRAIGCPISNKLNIWSKEVFGNVHSYVTEAETNLSEIQNQIHLADHSDTIERRKISSCQVR